MDPILCPECQHDIDQVLEINGKGECWTPVGDAEGNFCPCILRPSDIARALIEQTASMHEIVFERTPTRVQRFTAHLKADTTPVQVVL